MKILIADDNADDRKILKCNLEHHGCQVLEAIDGQDGLEAAELHMPDIIISDALMPRMDGFQFLRALKQDRTLQAIPFIFYSATYTGYKETDLALSFGAKAYIIKPKDPVEFWQELSKIIGECEPGSKTNAGDPSVQKDHEYLLKYSNIVANKLENKVQELEQALVERKKMEEQILQAKIIWEETFDTINDAITIHDKNFNIIRMNKAAEKLINLTPAAIGAQKCYESYHGTTCPPDCCPACETLKTGKIAVMERFEPKLNKFIEVRTLPRFDQDNQIIGLVHIVVDISERKKAEQENKNLQAQLFQSQKMESIGRLAGGVAHDFNNILTAIIGYSELLLKKTAGDPQIQEQLSIIMDSGKRAALLTQQLLVMSRKQVLTMGTYTLNDIIEGITGMITRIIGEDIAIEISARQRVDAIMADKGQIEQILLNLAVNARDAMPSGGSLTIMTENIVLDEDYAKSHSGVSPGPHVMLAVSDTGTGMSQDIQDRIFEPFFTTKELGRGTGLGLATVYGIVKQHNGHIFVYSEPGQGTTFKVFFPAVKKAAANAPAKPSGALPRGTESVLVVDDDPTVRKLIVDILGSLGYQVTSASNSEEALKVFGAGSPAIDMLLTDVVMPGMDGKALADAVTTQQPSVKVIFMSGYPHDAIAHHGILDPGVVLIQKPLTGTLLANTIRTVLDHKPEKTNEAGQQAQAQ